MKTGRDRAHRRWRPAVRALALCLWICVAGFSGCTAETAPGPEPACSGFERDVPAATRNVILIISDTMRRDRLGAYGGPAPTPAFDAFAREHVLFTRVVSQAPWTKPSIATLFSGLYPSQHGVVSHPDLDARDAVIHSDVLSGEVVTLAEAFQLAGHQTAAFVANPWLLETLGFAQGFDVYDHSFAGNDAPGTRVSRAALDWLAQRDSQAPYFLYLHYMDAHAPYQRVSLDTVERHRAEIEADTRPLSPTARLQIRQSSLGLGGRPLAQLGVPARIATLEMVYDEGIAAFDDAFGALLDGLANRPEWRDTAVVITSDHGEALYDRGWGSHGHGLYDDEIALPFAARLPGVSGADASGCVLGLVDVRASLCDYAGLPCVGPDAGRSLLAPVDTARVLLTEGVVGRERHRAINDGNFKLLYQPDGLDERAGAPEATLPEFAFFEVGVDDRTAAIDPAAASSEERAVYERLQGLLDTAIDARLELTPETRDLDEATRRRLEALGYLGEDD